jgi:hypothetical protein
MRVSCGIPTFIYVGTPQERKGSVIADFLSDPVLFGFPANLAFWPSIFS